MVEAGMTIDMFCLAESEVTPVENVLKRFL